MQKLLTTLALIAIMATLHAQTASDHYQAALARGKESKYNEAIAECDKAIALEPNNPDALYYRGVVKFVVRDSSGEGDLTRVIQIRPDLPKPYNFRGNYRFRREDYAGAIADFDKVIALKPDYLEAWFMRGDSKFEAHDFDGAIADLNKAIELKPDYVAAHHTKGLTYFASKDWKSAIEAFNKVLTYDDAQFTGSALYFKGVSEIETNLKEEGCKDLQLAVRNGSKAAEKAIAKYCN